VDVKTLIRKQIFAKNYYLARMGYSCWFFIKSFGKQCVLIYQMGKVGSRSVEASLLASRLDLPVFHIHYLSAEMLEKETDCFYDERCGSNRKLKGVFSRQLFESYFIRSAVLARPHPKKKWKIITLVREPIARNISALFHDLDEYIPGSHNNIYSIPYEELFQAFLEKVNHELPLTWFDIELNPLFGVDVYASPFPKEKGYQTYSS
jgi:hypothetical protein